MSGISRKKQDRYRIDITNEPVLRNWVRKASMIRKGYIPYAARLALEYFFENGVYTEIARVNMDDYDLSESPDSFFLSYKTSPILSSCIDKLSQEGFVVSRIIRTILAHSVNECDSDDEFFIDAEQENEDVYMNKVLEIIGTSPAASESKLTPLVKTPYIGTSRKKKPKKVEAAEESTPFLSAGAVERSVTDTEEGSSGNEEDDGSAFAFPGFPDLMS